MRTNVSLLDICANSLRPSKAYIQSVKEFDLIRNSLHAEYKLVVQESEFFDLYYQTILNVIRANGKNVSIGPPPQNE